MRVLVKCRVDEADRVLTARNTLLVDAVHDGGKYWRAGAGSAFERGVAVYVGCDIVAVGGNIRVAAADTVVESAV